MYIHYFMPEGQSRRWRHYVLTCLFVRLSVCSFVCYQTCEHDILKTTEPVLMPLGTSGLQGRARNVQLRGSRGQRSRSHKAEDIFVGLVEASCVE